MQNLHKSASDLCKILHMSEADLCKIYAHTCTLGGLFVPGWQYPQRYMYVHKILHMSASDMCKICTSLLQTCAKFCTSLKQTCANFAHVWSRHVQNFMHIHVPLGVLPARNKKTPQGTCMCINFAQVCFRHVQNFAQVWSRLVQILHKSEADLCKIYACLD